MNDELQPTGAAEYKEAATKLVQSPYTQAVFRIRKSSGADYLEMDFIPDPDPSLEPEDARKDQEKKIDDDPTIQARVQRDLIIKCVLEPMIVGHVAPGKIKDDEIHVDMLGPDLQWLFIEIDEFTRGQKGNPTIAQG